MAEEPHGYLSPFAGLAPRNIVTFTVMHCLRAALVLARGDTTIYSSVGSVWRVGCNMLLSLVMSPPSMPISLSKLSTSGAWAR